VKEHPLICNQRTVQAILAGRQTQDRRPIKPQPIRSDAWPDLWVVKVDGRPSGMSCINATDWDVRYWCKRWQRCPQIGDHLWVRETWGMISPDAEGDERWYQIRQGRPFRLHPESNPVDGIAGAIYRTDGEFEFAPGYPKWRSARHMPRWASRITLEVTNVRVQRVQEISEQDAVAEGLAVQLGDGKGFRWNGPGYLDVSTEMYHVADLNMLCRCSVGKALSLTPARCAFRVLWNTLYAKRDLGWDDNPWVFAATFRRLP